MASLNIKHWKVFCHFCFCQVCHWRQNLLGWGWGRINHKGFWNFQIKHILKNIGSTTNSLNTSPGWICGECGEEQVHLQHVHCGIAEVSPRDFYFNFFFLTILCFIFLTLGNDRSLSSWQKISLIIFTTSKFPVKLGNMFLLKQQKCYLDSFLFSFGSKCSETQ